MFFRRAKAKSGLQTKVKASLETVQRAIKGAFAQAATATPNGSAASEGQGEQKGEKTGEANKTKKPSRYQECAVRTLGNSNFPLPMKKP